jgi:hypothetical protein
VGGATAAGILVALMRYQRLAWKRGSTMPLVADE